MEDKEDDKVIPFPKESGDSRESDGNKEIEETLEKVLADAEARRKEEEKGPEDIIEKSEGILIKVKNSFIRLKSRNITIGKNVHIKNENAHPIERMEIVTPHRDTKIMLLSLLLGLAALIVGVLILSRNYSFRGQQRQSKTFEVEKKEGERATDLEILYGRVISSDNIPLTDVKVEIYGGSQLFSNSSGEFLINCRVGQLVINAL